jgi:hypothetical protein
MNTPTPRHYLSGSPYAPLAAWLATGGSDDRLSRIAARRNFVHVKRCFLAAVERIDGKRGQWLSHQVRQTNEAIDLWLLRGAVFHALHEERGAEGRELRRELQRALDSVFPDAIDEEPTLPM